MGELHVQKNNESLDADLLVSIDGQLNSCACSNAKLSSCPSLDINDDNIKSYINLAKTFKSIHIRLQSTGKLNNINKNEK